MLKNDDVSGPASGLRAAHIASVAAVVPSYSADQAFASEFLRNNFRERLSARSLGLIKSIFSHPSIGKRHFAIDDPHVMIDEPPDGRIRRFTEKSVELSAQAITEAVRKAGADLADVTCLIVNTCTGYVCPGISTYLMERMALPRNIRVYDMVGSGCGGAIPNLQVAESMVRTNGKGVVVSVSVEICSSTFQMGNDPSLIISNALFGDGAAAAVLWDRPQGLRLAASAGHYVPEQREAIRFVHKEGQLYNQLSLKLPDMVKKAAAKVVADVLSSQGLRPADIGHWALHTGGEKIINAVRDEIGIPEDRLRATRKVLKEYGNMSSPTVWFVLDEILKNGMAAGEWCVMIVYGAGLSSHACLLKKT